MVDAAIAQLPPLCVRRPWHRRRPAGVVHPVLVRADTASAVAAFVDGLVARDCEFSIGARVNDSLDAAIAAVAADAWVSALDANGQPRGAQLAEPDVTLATVCLDGELALVEHRMLRSRGRLVRKAGAVILRLRGHWPWT